MKLRKGMRVRCKIEGKEVKDAKIQDEDGELYICQNIKDGTDCKDKLGYKYSWGILQGTEEDLRRYDVEDLISANWVYYLYRIVKRLRFSPRPRRTC